LREAFALKPSSRIPASRSSPHRASRDTEG
jgi:hypothetical protein